MRTTRLFLVAIVGLLVFSPVFLAAQTTGRIVGTVVDAKTGEGLPGANMTVKGTYYGGTSDFDGNVRIEKVNPGA
jgi:hypothetical protein